MDTDILVIGAGPAGLAVAAALHERGLAPLLIERERAVGASWRSHYERLHLHTVKELSALPGLPFASSLPRYVPRAEVVAYLEAYAARAGIAPRFGVEAEAVVPDGGGGWRVDVSGGEAIRARTVVIGTGANNIPFVPRIDGQEGYAGEIVHSRAYRNAAPFAGRRVLVVGLGNTGAEIAADLAEHGVAVALSVRSPVNIVRRDVLGRPTQRTSLALARLPIALGDRLATWLCTLTVGDLGRYGLRRSAVSPLRELREQGRVAMIDVGTLARIAAGDIAVYPGLQRLTTSGADFVDGRHVDVDVVLLATGYRSGVAALLRESRVPVDASGLPRETTGTGELEGLYFVGFDTRQPGGLLRTIGLQATAVADAVAARQKPAARRSA